MNIAENKTALQARRVFLEGQLASSVEIGLFEEYFDIIERTGATDVPQWLIDRLRQVCVDQPMQNLVVLPDGRIQLDYVEMDISYACNLRCTNCSHYSNFVMSGVVTAEDAIAWMTNWSLRIMPKQFRIMGGEASINPKAGDIVRAAARLFPDTVRSVVSNGLVLHKREDLYVALAETRTNLNVSVHEMDPESIQRYVEIQKKCDAMGINLTLAKFDPNDFSALYKTTPEGPLPWTDGKPVQSWINCFGKNCIFLNDNMIWKCASLGMLRHLDTKSKITMDQAWAPYMGHAGVLPTASTQDILAYLNYPVKDCAICPSGTYKPSTQFAQRLRVTTA